MEPSCGEAGILVAAVERLRSLSSDPTKRYTVDGVEIHPPSASVARARVELAGGRANIQVADFFGIAPRHAYDAVIGNPPFIRFHDFSGAARAAALRAANSAGVEISGLASSWAAFVVHSAQFLVDRGKLAFVLPSELLTVDYASSIRRFLLENFGSVSVVTFSEPVFDGVQTDAILLLADSFGGHTDRVRMYSPISPEDLGTFPASRDLLVSKLDDKWSAARTTARRIERFVSATSMGGFARLRDWGKPSLGVVTGNNSYFTLTDEEAAQRGIPALDLVAVAPPMKPAKRGLAYTLEDWKAAVETNSRVHLFYPKSDELTTPLAQYVRRGVAEGVRNGYKCRSRSPWWRVPIGEPGDLIVTYMSSEMPRVCGNPEGYFHLNSLHRLTLRTPLRALGRSFLPIASLSSLTIIGAELVGRSYGGGVLKLELGEVASVPVPGSAIIESASVELDLLKPEVDRLLRSGQAIEASALVDDVLLRGQMGLSASTVRDLQATHTSLRNDRLLRSRPNVRAKSVASGDAGTRDQVSPRITNTL
jgi:hypothetical protein